MAKGKSINPTLKDCNCLNCRLSRIENQLSVLEHLIQSMDLPTQSKKKSTKKSKKEKS